MLGQLPFWESMESFHGYPDKLVQIKIKGFKLLLVTCTCLLISVLHSNRQQNSYLIQAVIQCWKHNVSFQKKKKNLKIEYGRKVFLTILLIICKSFSRSNSEIPQACKHFLASLSCNSCCSTGSVLVANILTTNPS